MVNALTEVMNRDPERNCKNNLLSTKSQHDRKGAVAVEYMLLTAVMGLGLGWVLQHSEWKLSILHLYHQLISRVAHP